MKADVVLVGGGLANCLIALRLSQLRDDLRLTVIEQGQRLGGNHLWSFHDTDLSPGQRDWLRDAVTASWPRYEVRFPAHRRTLEGGYNAVSSDRLDAVVRTALGARTDPSGRESGAVRTGTRVEALDPRSVTLANGETIAAALVIDGRGASESESVRLAYQKFLGLEVELARPHGLEAPILMDATVEQRDGYRFVYTLPLSERSLLIEDTRYSDGPRLDRDEMRRLIADYAERSGWGAYEVRREEEGVLPIVLAGDIEAYWREADAGVPLSGLRAMLFHPTTGYSLPDAVRLADEIASTGSLASEAIYELVRRRSIAGWRRRGFFRLLNRMLVRAAPPPERFKVLERFYRLPPRLIQRFYAATPSTLDKVRLLTGRPPVPIGRALAAVPASAAAPSRSGPRASEKP